MKRIIIFCAALLVGFAASAQDKAKVIYSTFESKLLGASRPYSVILPPGYEENPEKGYPILYLFHGMYGTEKQWVERGKADKELALLVKEHRCHPMIIVSPYAGGKDLMVEQNGYFDMTDWPYESFFFEEFLPFIESEYRVVGDKKHRAIAGLSMGGGGAVSYAQRHPDMFCASYAMSAWLGVRPEEKVDLGDGKNKKAYLYESVNRNHCVKYVENADEQTVAALKTVHWYIDCGDDDFLMKLNFEYWLAMKEKGIPCELRVRDGAHKWEYWHTALQLCLPFVSICFTE